MQEKLSCRQKAREIRQRFHESLMSSQCLSELTADLNKNLSTVISNNTGSVWATYSAHKAEVDTTVVTKELKTKKWVYPRIDGNEMSFYQIDEASQLYPTGSWGIKEPKPIEDKKVSLSQIDGFLVPGVAFTRNGKRLGQGGGYYDKALSQTSAIKIGVAYSAQLQENLPTEKHDIEMDYVVTEKEVIRVSSSVLKGI